MSSMKQELVDEGCAALNALYGQNVVAIRNARGLTQEELAAKAGFSRKTIADIEQGENGLTDNNLVRLSYALGVPSYALLVSRDKASIDALTAELIDLSPKGRAMLFDLKKVVEVYIPPEPKKTVPKGKS